MQNSEPRGTARPTFKRRYCGSKFPHDPHVQEAMLVGVTNLFYACAGKSRPVQPSTCPVCNAEVWPPSIGDVNHECRDVGTGQVFLGHVKGGAP